MSKSFGRYEHQMHFVYLAASRLRKTTRGLVAMHPTGAGKTAIGIFTLANFAFLKWIVVAPNSSILSQWRRAINDIINANTAPDVICQTKETCIFITYDDVIKNINALEGNVFVVCDEAHVLLELNQHYPDKLVAQLWDTLQTKSKRVLLLTASPFKDDMSQVLDLAEIAAGKTIVENRRKNIQRTDHDLKESLVWGRLAPYVGSTVITGAVISLVSNMMKPASGQEGTEIAAAAENNYTALMLPVLLALIYGMFFKPKVDKYRQKLKSTDVNKVMKYAAPYIDIIPRHMLTMMPTTTVLRDSFEIESAILTLLLKMMYDVDIINDLIKLRIVKTSNEAKQVVIKTIDAYKSWGRRLSYYSTALHPEKEPLKIKKSLDEMRKKDYKRVCVYSWFADVIDVFEMYLLKRVPKCKIYKASPQEEIPFDALEHYDVVFLERSMYQGVNVNGCWTFVILDLPDSLSAVYQLLGRTKRLTSHAHLPPEDRHCLYYIPTAVFPDGNELHSGVERFKAYIQEKRVLVREWLDHYLGTLSLLAMEKKIPVMHSPDDLCYDVNMKMLEEYQIILKNIEDERMEQQDPETCQPWFPFEVEDNHLPKCFLQSAYLPYLS